MKKIDLSEMARARKQANTMIIICLLGALVSIFFGSKLPVLWVGFFLLFLILAIIVAINFRIKNKSWPTRPLKIPDEIRTDEIRQ